MDDMLEGMKLLYSGDFNDMSQDWQPNGSVIITISKRSENKSYRFRVRDLYGENEQVLEHEILEHSIKPWLKQRMDQAKKQKNDDFRGE